MWLIADRLDSASDENNKKKTTKLLWEPAAGIFQHLFISYEKHKGVIKTSQRFTVWALQTGSFLMRECHHFWQSERKERHKNMQMFIHSTHDTRLQRLSWSIFKYSVLSFRTDSYSLKGKFRFFVVLCTLHMELQANKQPPYPNYLCIYK